MKTKRSKVQKPKRSRKGRSNSKRSHARKTKRRTTPAKGKSKSRGRRSIREEKAKWVILEVPDEVPDFEWDEEMQKDWEESGPHAYDKAKWHYEGDYPEGLPEEQAYVHTGLFAGWLIDHDMITEEFLPAARQFKRRKITGPQAYMRWGGALLADMLTEEGNLFAREYYDGAFGDDYQKLLVRKLPSFYHVQDTWENYEILKRRIDERYEAWKRKNKKRE